MLSSKKIRKKLNIPTFSKAIQLIYNLFRLLCSKLSILYSLNISLIFLVFLFLSYYLILVNIKPFSSQFIKNNIISEFAKNSDYNINISDVLASFTYDGKLKIKISRLTLNNDQLDETNFRDFRLDNATFEIPIYRILIFSFMPTSLIIDDAQLEINALSSTNSDLNIKKNIFRETGGVIGLFEEIQLRNFELFVRNKTKSDVTLKLINSKFNIDINGDILLNNKSDIIANKKLIQLTSNCKLEKKSFFGNCRFYISNFDMSILASLYNEENILDHLSSNSEVGLNISFDKKIKIRGQINSKNISIKPGTLFLNESKFSDSIINGELNIENDIFSFDVNSEFNINESKLILNSSAKDASKNIAVDFKLQNVAMKNINDLWPKKFYHLNVRKWLNKRVLDGYIYDSFIKLNFSNNKVDKFNASVFAEGLHLNYHDNYPDISDIKLAAHFTKKAMNLIIDSAIINKSDISNASVTISDFSDPKINISADFFGNSTDLFSHINYKSKNINSFLHSILTDSYSDANINLSFPIKKGRPLKFKNINLAINAKTTSIYNDYFSGSYLTKINKIQDNQFLLVKLDFLDSFTLKNNPMDIKKLHNDNLTVTSKIYPSKNTILIDEAEVSLNLKPIIKLDNFLFNIKSKKLTTINCRQDTNGKKYTFKVDKKASISTINLNADLITLTGDGKASKALSFLHLSNFILDVNIKNIISKNVTADNFKLYAKCQTFHCSKINSTAFNDSKPIFNLVNDSKFSYYFRFFDVGYFLELFNISHSIKGGDIELNFIFDKDGNIPIYKGKLTSNSDLTLFDNETFKRFESDDLFDKIKDKIFSNNKTSFSRIIANFKYFPASKEVKFDKFIANNLKIGITSKGEYNLLTGRSDIKGMIIPAYFINNLFGIGNVPIVGDVLNKLVIGNEFGGVFGLRYKYSKSSNSDIEKFKTYPMSSILPSSIQNLLN